VSHINQPTNCSLCVTSRGYLIGSAGNSIRFPGDDTSNLAEDGCLCQESRPAISTNENWRCVLFTSLWHFGVFVISSTRYSKAIILFQAVVWERCRHGYYTEAMRRCSMGDRQDRAWAFPLCASCRIPALDANKKKPVHSVCRVRSGYHFQNSRDRTTWLLEANVGKSPEGHDRWSICDTAFCTHCKKMCMTDHRMILNRA
jgi:hypothetical protein